MPVKGFSVFLALNLVVLPSSAAAPPLGSDPGTKKCGEAYTYWLWENKKPTIGPLYDDPGYVYRAVIHEICPSYLRTGWLPSDLEQIHSRHTYDAFRLADKTRAKKMKVYDQNTKQHLAMLSAVKLKGSRINQSADRFHYYSVNPGPEGKHFIYEITISRSSIVSVRRYDGSYDANAILVSTVNGQNGGSLRFRIFCKEGMNTAIDNSGRDIPKPDRFWVSTGAGRWACSRR